MVDLGGAEGVAAVDYVYLLGHAGEEQGVGCRGVAAAHHCHGLAAIEHAVAGGAVVDAAPEPLFLSSHAQGAGGGAGGQHDHLCLKDALVGDGALDGARELQRLHLRQLRHGAEALGAGLHLLPQGEAVNALVKAGIVVHPLGEGNLPAGGELFQHHGLEPGAGAVERGGITGGAAADDHHIIASFHGNSSIQRLQCSARKESMAALEPGATMLATRFPF